MGTQAQHMGTQAQHMGTQAQHMGTGTLAHRHIAHGHTGTAHGHTGTAHGHRHSTWAQAQHMGTGTWAHGHTGTWTHCAPVSCTLTHMNQTFAHTGTRATRAVPSKYPRPVVYPLASWNSSDNRLSRRTPPPQHRTWMCVFPQVK